MKKQILDKIRSLNISFEKQSDTSNAAASGKMPGDVLDAYIKRVTDMPPPDNQPRNEQEWRSGLNKLVAELDTNELAGFIRALLYEDPDLMTELRFIPSRYASQTELVFDWAMNLPYTTLKRTFDILERLFEEALALCKTDERAVGVMAKIKAITAKHRDGLPFSYLRRKVGQTGLEPKLRLELAQIMLQHKDYDLDYDEAAQLLNVPGQPYMLPAMMETYLRDEEDKEGPYKALRLLNTMDEKSFPPKGVDIGADMEYVLEEIARTLKKGSPGGWKNKLAEFAGKELAIVNADLRNLVEGVFDHLELEAPSPGPGAEDKVEKLELEPVSGAVEPQQRLTNSAPLIEEDKLEEAALLSLEEELSEQIINEWVNSAVNDAGKLNVLVFSIIEGLKKNDEITAINMKPLLMKLEARRIDMEAIFRNFGVLITLTPYTVDAPFMRKFVERRTAQIEDFIRAGSRLNTLFESNPIKIHTTNKSLARKIFDFANEKSAEINLN